MMSRIIFLEELARQVRTGTLDLLRAVRESWLTWAPEGTSNHILWHAGHALWLLHDESRHQGEMYLLLKLCRARGV